MVFTHIYFGKLKNSTLFGIGIAECKYIFDYFYLFIRSV